MQTIEQIITRIGAIYIASYKVTSINGETSVRINLKSGFVECYRLNWEPTRN